MKRIRRLIRAWNEPSPQTIVVNVAASDPVATGKEIAARLREYQRSTGRPLRFD